MKNAWLKTLGNFVAVNVCALLPLLWVAFGWMPDQVKVQWKGDDAYPVTIVSDDLLVQGEAYGQWSEGTEWRFYLRNGMEWKDLSFRLASGKGPENLGRIDFQKWKLVKFSQSGSELVPAKGGEQLWHFPSGQLGRMGFASAKTAVGLAMVEMFLFGLSFLFAKCRGKEGWKELLPSVLCVALVLATLMQVALPIRAYLANQSLYPFSPGELAGWVALRFAWMFVITGVSVGLLSRCFGRWVCGAVLAFALCVYLETGALSLDFPPLNGNWWFFQNRTRAVWDAVAWGAVFAVVLGSHRFLRHRYGFASLFLLAVVVTSIFEAKHEKHADLSNLVVDDFAPIQTVLNSVAYSTNRNVMVFVVDSLEREQAHAIMDDPEAGPRLREQFWGFTEYVDNVGTGNASEIAVAAMLTGKYPDSLAGLPEYFVSVFGKDSPVADYLAAGADVYVATTALGYGYASRKEKDGVSGGNGGWTLDEVVRFRWVPFAAKLRCARIMELGQRRSDGIDRERVAYPILASRATRDDCPACFLFLHTMGVHFPVQWNRRGELLPAANDSFGGVVEAGIYVLGQLGSLFDIFRERGLYDNSLILVLADHGNHGHKEDTPGGLPGTARPFLWVKEPGSDHDFTSGSQPTSHARISTLLREASQRNLEVGEAGDILSSERRLYREAFGLTQMDWWVENDGRVTRETGEMTKSSQELRPLKAGHTYSFDLTAAGASEVADIELSGLFLRFWPRWFNGRKEIRIRFRPPEAQGHWRVRLAVLPWMWSPDETDANEAGARFLFRVDGREVAARTSGEAVLRGVVAGEDGLVTIVVEREPGIKSICRLTQLTIEAER